MTKELRNGLSLADDDIIRGGLGLVTDKTKKKKTEPPARTACLRRAVKNAIKPETKKNAQLTTPTPPNAPAKNYLL